MGVGVGVADGEDVGGCDRVADAEGDGLPLGDGDGAVVVFVVVVGGAALSGADPDPEPGRGDGDVGVGDGSGTLARTSSGSARSRAGASYENSPLANPAATTATAAPVTASRAVRRRRRGGSSGKEAGGGYGGSCAEFAESTCCTALRASDGTVRRRTVAGPDSFAVRSTYGRMRRGSKSSAAAASAVRASRRASDARRVQAQDGVPSGVRGAAHSGQTCPFGSVTRWVPPPETRPLGTPEVSHIHHTFSQGPPESLLPQPLQASTGHNPPYRPPWRVTETPGAHGRSA